MYICQNGDFIHGYSDESFIFRGTRDVFDVLTGNFYQAGSGPCATGTFELDLTTWGVEGFYICSNGKVNTWSAVRMSEFRPSPEQCATLWNDDDIDLEGRWENDDRLFLDLCFRDPDDDGGDDDDETVQASFQYLDEEGVAVDVFATGFWYEEGKIFTGTWYQDFLGGPIMMFLRDNGDINYTAWTGLFQQEGRTFLDGSQINNELHTVGHWNAPRTTSTSNQCTRYEVLQTFVLKNLRAIVDSDDDNYYYFIDEEYLSSSRIEYRAYAETDSPASTTIISFILVSLGLLAAFF